MEHTSNGNTNFNRRDWNGPKTLGKGTGIVGNRRPNRDHPNYSIVKIRKNTKKNSGNLRRFAVIETPVKDHHLIQ